MYKAICCVALGGALGSVLRWLLSITFNSLYLTIPLGTLAANLLAGYLIGIFLAVFMIFPTIAAEWRLFLITGCLGGLSTFSTFSAEVAILLQQQRMIIALVTIGVHVIGSVLLTLLGLITVYALKG